MQTSQIIQYAHALYRALGPRAEAAAAARARKATNADDAECWRSVRFKIKELRGPRMT